MIGQTLLRRSLAQTRYGTQVVSASNRSFAGGGNKPKPIDPKTTDYDILFVGKYFTLQTSRHLNNLLALTATYSPNQKSSQAWRLLIQLHLRSHLF
jgi:hypothetical protein